MKLFVDSQAPRSVQPLTLERRHVQDFRAWLDDNLDVLECRWADLGLQGEHSEFLRWCIVSHECELARANAEDDSVELCCCSWDFTKDPWVRTHTRKSCSVHGHLV